jgi:hypothetical protein
VAAGGGPPAKSPACERHPSKQQPTHLNFLSFSTALGGKVKTKLDTGGGSKISFHFFTAVPFPFSFVPRFVFSSSVSALQSLLLLLLHCGRLLPSLPFPFEENMALLFMAMEAPYGVAFCFTRLQLV